MRIHPDHLLSFVALVQTGSVSAAAASRHLTQPAISNQLARLQQGMGGTLYRRQGRGVRLTAAGEAFYRHALNVQRSLQQVESYADELQGLQAGRVNIAASQTIAGSLLPAAVLAFRQLYPQIEIFIESSNSQQVFEHMADYDFGLVENLLPSAVPDCCRVEPLGEDMIVAVMRSDHLLARGDSVRLQQLTEHELIWREPGSGTRGVLEQALMVAHGSLPTVQLSLGGILPVLEAVRQGLGIAVVSQFCLPTGEQILTTRPLRPKLCRPMSLLLPGHASALARKFADFLIPFLRHALQTA